MTSGQLANNQNLPVDNIHERELTDVAVDTGHLHVIHFHPLISFPAPGMANHLPLGDPAFDWRRRSFCFLIRPFV